MLPTLLRPGFIVTKGLSKKDKERIDNTIAIEHIREFFSDRVPRARNQQPKIRPKKYGDKIVVIKADTGSGKSTVIPPDLYLSFFSRTRKNIIITQPRILTAIDIPNIIVQFVPELELDKNIGYNTGLHKRLPQEKGIVFSTIGVLTQQLINDDDETFMSRYQFIVIDEVHERDIDTDLCLFLLKRLIEKNYDNPDCPIIVLMSATFNESIFIDYFDVPTVNYIEVIGSTYPITENFTEYSVANYLQFASAKAKKLHLLGTEDFASKFRDIIIFVKDTSIGEQIYEEMTDFNTFLDSAGPKQIEKYAKDLDKGLDVLLKKGGAPTTAVNYILPILLDKTNFDKGGLEYQNLFSKLETINVPIWRKPSRDGERGQPYKYVNPSRRIIISTNIAETGVTIPTLKYCIDTGYHFSVEFNPEVGCNVYSTKSVTRGMARQRRGRVGRNAPGIWEPCYTKETFESMQVDQYSKIITSDTTENLLGIIIKENEIELVKMEKRSEAVPIPMFRLTDPPYMLEALKNTNISALDFIELPSMQALGFSLEKLHILGFIDDAYCITPLGFYANKLRFIPLETRRMIMAGYCYGANILDLITISAFVYISKRKCFAKGFSLENFLTKNDAEFIFYSRVLIADDFIYCIFVWNLLQEFITKKLKGISSRKLASDKISGAIYLPAIEEWCEENGLLFEGLLQVIALREQIIENMITIGMDPYYNSLELPKYRYNLNNIFRDSLIDGLEEVKKIKLCIYEGFKCNLLSNNRGYISVLKNIKMRVKSPLTAMLAESADQKAPQYVIVDSYALSQKFESAQFEFIAEGYVSVLDGYVNVDESFFI